MDKNNNNNKFQVLYLNIIISTENDFMVNTSVKNKKFYDTSLNYYQIYININIFISLCHVRYMFALKPTTLLSVNVSLYLPSLSTVGIHDQQTLYPLDHICECVDLLDCSSRAESLSSGYPFCSLLNHFHTVILRLYCFYCLLSNELDLAFIAEYLIMFVEG